MNEATTTLTRAGLRILTPALRHSRCNPNLTRNNFHRRTLWRQQPCYHPVLVCLSVPCHLSSLSPPSSRSYRGDNYSDAGGSQHPHPIVFCFGQINRIALVVTYQSARFFGVIPNPPCLYCRRTNKRKSQEQPRKMGAVEHNEKGYIKPLPQEQQVMHSTCY